MKKRKEISDELREIAPGTHFPEKMAGFNVPEGYFGAVAGDILQAIQVNGKSAPVPPFAVPEGYFERLAEKIAARAMEQGETGREAVVVNLPLRKRIAWKYLAAAVMTGIIICTVMYVHTRHQNFDYQLAKISDQDIEQYLQYNTDVFDNDLLYNNVSTDNTDSLSVGDGLSGSDIREYLDESADMTDTTLN